MQHKTSEGQKEPRRSWTLLSKHAAVIHRRIWETTGKARQILWHHAPVDYALRRVSVVRSARLAQLMRALAYLARATSGRDTGPFRGASLRGGGGASG